MALKNCPEIHQFDPILITLWAQTAFRIPCQGGLGTITIISLPLHHEAMKKQISSVIHHMLEVQYVSFILTVGSFSFTFYSICVEFNISGFLSVALSCVMKGSQHKTWRVHHFGRRNVMQLCQLVYKEDTARFSTLLRTHDTVNNFLCTRITRTINCWASVKTLQHSQTDQ